jgi:hypothetical protein
MEVKPGQKAIILITFEGWCIFSSSCFFIANNFFLLFLGRFDIMSTTFKCKFCESAFDASDSDYVSAGYWPGILEHQSHYFCQKMLRFWYHLKHKAPGTSEGQFVKILEELSFEAERVINKIKSIEIFVSKFNDFNVLIDRHCQQEYIFQIK